MTQSSFNPFFWVKALLDPVRSLDLVDRGGRPDHAKVVPFLVSLAAIVLHAIGNPIPLGHLVVLVSAAFGYGSWRTFLSSRAVVVNQNNSNIEESRATLVETKTTTRTEVAHVTGDER